MSAWVVVIVGAVIWIIGQRIPLPKHPEGLRMGRIFSLLGLGVFLFGAYAGWQGPVSFGTVTVRTFSFAHFVQKSNTEALSYARSSIRLTSRPSAVWRGASKTDLQCVVANTGNKSLHTLTFSFVTVDNTTVNVRVRGPYPANTKKDIFVELPKKVLRSYFAASGMTVSQISGATF